MSEEEVKKVVACMESVEGFMFPDTQLGHVRHSYKDTFDGLSLLLTNPTVH